MLNVIYHAFLQGNVCLTGGGGVGKTFLTNEIIKLLKNDNKKFAVTAMTGLASTHLEFGMTMHSFTGISNFVALTDFHAVKSSKAFRSAVKSLKEVEFLFVDESSMWRPDTFELVDGVCRFARDKMDIPFGGIKLMDIGDFLQLPPVIGREERLKEQWCFETKSWEEAQFKIFNLTEIKRQSDRDLINGLNALRFGEYSKEAQWLLKECKDRVLEHEAVVLMSKRKDVDGYNCFKLDLLSDKLECHSCITKIHQEADDPRRVYAQLLDKGLEKEIVLKIGSRVMITANMQNGLKNGMTGTYLGMVPNVNAMAGDFMNDAMRILLDNGKEVVLPRLRLSIKSNWRWNKDGEEAEDGYIMQFPIKLAFAITIHKSQGMSLDNVMVDTNGIFADGQLYVAASRAKTLEGLSIRGFNKRHIKANAKAVNFYRSLQ